MISCSVRAEQVCREREVNLGWSKGTDGLTSFGGEAELRVRGRGLAAVRLGRGEGGEGLGSQRGRGSGG